MDSVIIDDIPFRADRAALAQRLRIAADSEHAHEFDRLVAGAEAVARPKALYRLGFIDERGDDYVVVDGTTFRSRILTVNLAEVHRVFLYVATCGAEIERWAQGLDDLLHRYWADAIQESALRSASRALHRALVERHQPGKTATMAPGSLSEWPLSEQRALFASLGNVREAIGVTLTDSMLMTPAKSISGIRFPTVESFESCQLCARVHCPGRRAPYDSELYALKYAHP
ncbi:MAG: vitamin B12 dependent methionine synthase [Anaerolineae bacterium]|nr:vitamin B12 dependent methionine synthase [Anaerolineae bacterium]